MTNLLEKPLAIDQRDTHDKVKSTKLKLAKQLLNNQKLKIN